MRVLFVARGIDVADLPHDGFIIRHRRMIELTAGVSTTGVLVLEWDQEHQAPHEAIAPLVVDSLVVRQAREGTWGRRQRLLALVPVGKTKMFAWQEAMLQAVKKWQPNVVVTIGPWWNDEFRPLFELWPCVHLLEEDLLAMPELAPQSRRARLLRYLEARASARYAQPAAVVVISDREAPAALLRHPGAELVVMPYTLDIHSWPRVTSPSDGTYIAVLGVLSQARNAEGLAEVLELFRQSDRGDLRFQLFSDRGVHPVLRPYLELPWVQYVRPAPSDAFGIYRGARLALVPAKRATGMKTTILQSWAAGCPVVAYRASAATIGAGFQGAIVAGEDVAGVAAAIKFLWNDGRARTELASAGLAALEVAFDDTAHHENFILLLRRIAKHPRGTSI